ncbi:Stk1 family PASTA domain-containing Ser/Thr kinase [Peptostreptococcaceae bacterium AGR-M142]
MINKTLKNRYEILEKIGEGGTSKIYKAKCKLLNRYVAIKILKDEFLEDEEFLKNFKNESKSAASISHPNIVNIYDVGEEDNIHFIVMEYVEGVTLKEYIKKEGKIELEKALDIIKQIALALDKAHKSSIIHRDIKPENILISNENLVKILDFGIAKAITKSTVINKKEIIGSIYYLSPEQVKGQIVDEGADIYALGIILYEMLTGILPFSGDTPVDIALKHVNEELDLDKLGNYSFEIKEFVAKMTNKNRMKRYNKAKDVVNDLESIKKGGRISNKKPSDFNTKKIDDIDFKKILDKEDSKKNNSGEIDLKSVLTKDNRGKKIKNKKNKKQAILGGVLAFFVSILFAFGFIFIKNMVTKKEYKTPDMTNLSFVEAKDILTQKNIFLVKRREEYNKDVIKNNIISQVPSPGTIIKEGDEIAVVTSLGMPLTKVPSFKGKKLVDAPNILKESNLEEGLVDYEYSNIVSEGVIISQNPQAFTKVQEGSSVNFIVSQGREIKIITVPNLIGKTIDEAKMELKGIYLGKIEYKEDREKEEGKILQQSLPSNSSAEEGSKINIIVNKYEELQEEDSLLTSDDENDLTDLVKKSFTIPLSTDKEEIHVFIKEIKNNKEKIIYNKKVNPKQVENILYINVKGKPGETKKYEIYLDESLYFDPVITF